MIDLLALASVWRTARRRSAGHGYSAGSALTLHAEGLAYEQKGGPHERYQLPW